MIRDMNYISSDDKYEIRLDKNESFMPINEELMTKLKSSLASIDMNRYPDNDMKKIQQLYGKYCSADEENIIVTNGSDEALELVISTYVKEGSLVLVLNPDFSMYDFYIKKFGGITVKYDINEKMEFNVDDFIELGKREKVDLIIFSNPNNPTGTVVRSEDILKILASFKDTAVLVDEAYYEFYGESVIKYINDYKNLIVTRTLSKAWAMAAIRIGFLITNKDLIKALYEKKTPYTVSSYSKKLCELVLAYPKNVKNNAEVIKNERSKMYQELKEIQKDSALNIEFFNSHANFIYGRTEHKKILLEGLLGSKIYIRNFAGDGFRITVGSPMQNRKLIQVLRKLLCFN